MIRLLEIGLMIIDDWVFAPGGETYYKLRVIIRSAC